jgi:predicted exporter
MLPFFALVRLAMWWVILLALAIESLALRYLFGMNWRRAVRVVIIVNAISLLCGVAFYPLAGCSATRCWKT